MQTDAASRLATSIHLAALAIVVLVDLFLLVLWLGRRSDEELGRSAPLVGRQWSLIHAWIAVQVAFGGALAAQILLVPILFAAGLLRHTPHGGPPVHHTAGLALLIILPVTLIVQNALLFGLPAWLITRRYGSSLVQIGLRPFPYLRDVVIGFFGAFGVLMAAWIASAFLGVLLYFTFGERFLRELSAASKSLTVEGLLGAHMSTPLFVELFVGAAILAPVCEELFFRGLVYNCARQRFGVPAAVVISAAAFSLLHLGPLVIAGIFVMGVAFALVYEYTRSLWTTIIMHGTINGTQLIFVFLLSRYWPEVLK